MMAKPSDASKAGARLQMLSIMQSIQDGTIASIVATDKKSMHIPFPQGTTPDPTGSYVVVEALAHPDALAFFGLDSTQGHQYVQVKIFCTPDSAGNAPSLPAGMWPLPDLDITAPYDAAGHQMYAWLNGDAGATWQGACSSGSNCFILDQNGNQVAAPLGVTFPYSQCIGTGWIRKPLREFAGYSSWPSNAPQQ